MTTGDTWSTGTSRLIPVPSSRCLKVGANPIQYRRSQPRAIGYIEEPRRSTHRARSVSRRRVSEVEVRNPRGSFVDERAVRRSVSRVRY